MMTAATEPDQMQRRRSTSLLWVLAGLVVAALVAGLVIAALRPPDPLDVRRFDGVVQGVPVGRARP